MLLPKKRMLNLLKVIVAVLALAVAAASVSLVNGLLDPLLRENATEQIRMLGFKGLLLFMALQTAQIIVAIIPGEPVELLAGALYGVWGGLAACTAGGLLASALVFVLARRFGRPWVKRRLPPTALKRFAFLEDTRKISAAVFILFLLPGTPKDILTYAAGLSRIPAGRFLILSMLARVPSVVSSTIIGATARAGDWEVTLAVTAVTVCAGLWGYLHQDAIAARFRRGKKTSGKNPG
jgi:uncharacterized membrane protein YdjX (TVP38/TMEM64 family)